MTCKNCGHKLLLGTVWVNEIIPDAEPYDSDEELEMEPIDISASFSVHCCEGCGEIVDIEID